MENAAHTENSPGLYVVPATQPLRHPQPYAGALTQREALREKAWVVGLVTALHVLVIVLYWTRLQEPTILVNEMSVSFASFQLQQQDAVLKPKPVIRQREIEPDPEPAEQVAVQEAPPPPPDVTPPSRVVLDDEPDYRADYLDNPRPPYPTTARQMGYQGIVLLNVEVLAEGKAGEVQIKTSSGHAILDNAALQTVKTWRFVPAHRFGEAVTAWFQVPIRFVLGGG